SDWQPLTQLARSLAAHQCSVVGIVVESELTDSPVGTVILPGSAAVPWNITASPKVAEAASRLHRALDEAARSGRAGWFESVLPRWKVFALPLSLPPRLLLLGAGPDAAPVVDFAGRLNWKVTLVDHRPAYADATHFPSAERVVHASPEDIPL